MASLKHLGTRGTLVKTVSSLAVVAFPYFISSITSKIVQVKGIAFERSTAFEQLHELLSRRSIPMPLAAAARFHLRHHFLQRNRATGENVLKLLPVLLQADLLYEMRTPVLQSSSFLKHMHSNYSALVGVAAFALQRAVCQHPSAIRCTAFC